MTFFFGNLPSNSNNNNRVLIVPSVCLGNIGQMAADLIVLNSQNAVYCGAFNPRYALPFTGSNAFEGAKKIPLNSPPISLPFELYHLPDSNTFLLQQRSPFMPVSNIVLSIHLNCTKGMAKEFVEELIRFAKEFEFTDIICLSALDALYRGDSDFDSPLRYLSMNNVSDSLLC